MPPSERHNDDDDEHGARMSRKAGNPLQRGSACLSCRKRKMKCDATKPVCRQCVKANRADECEYDDGRQKSRTQILQEKIAKLEERIRELDPLGDLHDPYSDPPGYAETMGLGVHGGSPDAFGAPEYASGMGGGASDAMGVPMRPGAYGDPMFAGKHPPHHSSHSHSSSVSGSTGFSPLVMGTSLPPSVAPSLVPSAYSSTASLAHPASHPQQYALGQPPEFFASPGSMFYGLPASPGSSHSGDGAGSSASSSNGHVQNPQQQQQQYHAQWQQIPQASGSGSYDSLFSAPPPQNPNGMASTPFGLPLDMNEVDVMFGGGVAADSNHNYSRANVHGMDSSNGWGSGDLSRAHKEMLLEIFVPHAKQCGLDFDVARLYQRMGLATLTAHEPQTQSVHPALANAIFLLACHFSSSNNVFTGIIAQAQPQHATVPNPTSQEQHFLTLALRGIAAALEEGEPANEPPAVPSSSSPSSSTFVSGEAASAAASSSDLTAKDRGASPLVDAVQASVLLAVYFYGKARLLEGYYHSSAAARLALALGMHQIDSTASPDVQAQARTSPPMSGTDIALPEMMAGDASSETTYATRSNSHSSASPSPTPSASSWGTSQASHHSASLPPPRDAAELAERVSTFWSVFRVDRCWSVATGLPSSLPDDSHPQLKFSTPWSWEPSDNTQNVEGLILGSLYDAPKLYQSLPLSSTLRPSTKSLKSKAVAFFERAARIASMQQDPAQWEEVASTERALTQFIEILPELAVPTCTSVDPEVVVVYTLAHVSAIQLHHPRAQKDPAAHAKCLRAAETTVLILRRIPDLEFQFLDPIIGTCWMCAADVFIRERAWTKQQHHASGVLFDLEEKLSTLVDALNKLSCTFPVAKFQAQKVDQSRSTMY